MTNNNKIQSQYEAIGERVSIFKRGRNWYANFQLDGKQHRQSLRTSSLKQARRAAINLEARLQDGRFAGNRREPTIAEISDLYLAYLQAERRARKTIQKVELVIRRIKALADRRKVRLLKAVDLSFVDTYREERVAAKAKAKTVSNETVIVRQIVNFALSRKLITDDPLAGLKIKKPKLVEQPCWTRVEVDAIVELASGWHRDALVALADTGMRVGELRWLTWSDVDLERNVLHVRPKDGWQPKTGNQRKIPICPALRTVLDRRDRSTRWVVPAPTSRRFSTEDRQFSDRRLLQYLKRLLNKLGLKGHLHTFRHSFISHALICGTPESIVRDWVGHVDPEIMKRYTHINDAASQVAMSRLTANDHAEKSQAGP